jgi:hypothetical protein
MNRLLTVVATTGVIIVASQALAMDSDNQSTMSKRQMISQIVGCMKKRMSANKDGSYREAMKVCRNQIDKRSDTLPVASDTQAKP